MGNPGRREFVQVLRLMEDFHQHQVEQAASEAVRLGTISIDAVKMLLLARLENRPARYCVHLLVDISNDGPADGAAAWNFEFQGVQVFLWSGCYSGDQLARDCAHDHF